MSVRRTLYRRVKITSQYHRLGIRVQQYTMREGRVRCSLEYECALFCFNLQLPHVAGAFEAVCVVNSSRLGDGLKGRPQTT